MNLFFWRQSKPPYVGSPVDPLCEKPEPSTLDNLLCVKAFAAIKPEDETAVALYLTPADWSTVFIALDILRKHNFANMGPKDFYLQAGRVWEHLRDQVRVE